MLFGKPVVSIFLKTQSLEFTSRREKPKIVLDLPAEAVQNQEVMNPKLLDKLVTEFLVNNRLQNTKGALMLSDEVIYQKVIPIADSKSEEYETQKFLDEVPFDNPNIALKKIKEDTNLHLFATNKLLFYAFKNILEKNGIKIEKVGTLSSNTLNFMEDDDDGDSGKPPSHSVKIILGIFVLIFALVAGGIFAYLKLANKAEPLPSPEPTASSEPTGEPSPEPAEAPKEVPIKDYSVQVLNGAGVVGTAQSVSGLLLAYGFETPETGNADNYEYKGVVVELKVDVPSEIIEKIKEALGEGYAVTASDKKLPEDSEYDVVLVVGKSE